MSDTTVKEKKPRAPKAQPATQALAPGLPKKADGSYDWRSIVGEENIILNKFYWAKHGKVVTALEEDEIERLKAESPEEGLVVLLKGFRKIAQLRGVKSVDYDLVDRTEERATVKCKITLIPTVDEPYERVICGIANYSLSQDGSSDDYKYFSHAEAMASNRASNRAWREYLNMSSVSLEEINPSDKVPEPKNVPSLTNVLIEKLEAAGKKDSDIEALINNKFELSDKWNGTLSSLQPEEVMELLNILK